MNNRRWEDRFCTTVPFAAGNVDHAKTASCRLLIEQSLFIL
jgi:hypothetical protein